MHALGDAPRGGIKRLKALARRFQIACDLLVLEIHALGLGVQAIERRHPGGDLVRFELVAQNKVALCGL